MRNSAIYIGLDLGTSGARAIAMNDDGTVIGEGKSMMADHGENIRSPDVWWAAAATALQTVCNHIDGTQLAAICVDGTSGTMIPINASGTPLAHGKMYNDPCMDTKILETIACHAPETSAAHGSTSGLAKVLMFQQTHQPALVVHQADWISGCLCGVFASDDNNALKTGFDPVSGQWPQWIAKTGCDMRLLPVVNAPGTPIGKLLPEIAARFNLSCDAKIVAGTTDGCASFLATGAENPGDGVSALGTTLTIKLLSESPIFDPACGVYSHHILGKWLAGGASNTGGHVLLAHFTSQDIDSFSRQIDAETDSGLNYYPLIKPGERFPVCDPELAPRMEPKPKDRLLFFKAILEGIANVEALAYAKLTELGGPALTCVRSVGGGAKNKVWTRLRQRRLHVPMLKLQNTEAAYGAARLAKLGLLNSGLAKPEENPSSE